MSDSPAPGGLRILTEPEMAALRAEEGRHVVERGGRFWAAIFPGFYQPVHLLAPFAASEIARPTAACWGYRAALVPEDAGAANGSIPVHLMTGLDRFDEGHLAGDRRRDLKRSRQSIVFRRPDDPEMLEAHGYAVFRSAQDRLHYWPDLGEAAYRERIRRHVLDGRRLLIAGLIDGRIAGYMESFAVDGVLYTDDLIVATEALNTGISTGLYVEAIHAAIASGGVHSVCLGLETPDRPGLSAFKLGLRFPVVHVPARHAIPGPIDAFIRARRPAVHYRLTGRGLDEG